MIDRKNDLTAAGIGPLGAVATVPGEYIATAIFEVVQGAVRAGGAIGRVVGRIRRS